MKKTYYFYSGITIKSVTDFVGMLLFNMVSFEYDHEAETITVKDLTESDIACIDSYVKHNCHDIHDTAEIH